MNFNICDVLKIIDDQIEIEKKVKEYICDDLNSNINYQIEISNRDYAIFVLGILKIKFNEMFENGFNEYIKYMTENKSKH